MRRIPFRIGRTACLLISALVVGGLTVACQPGGSGDSGMMLAESKRFTFVRGKNQLLRIESATGRVWAVPENGDGGWVELEQAPGPDGEPETPGRYGLFSIVDRLNIAPNRLLLVDRATGRSWLREASGGRIWNPIGDAGDPLEEEAPEAGWLAQEPVRRVRQGQEQGADPGVLQGQGRARDPLRASRPPARVPSG